MKPIHTMLTMAAVLMAACTPTSPYFSKPAPRTTAQPAQSVAKQRQYLALPGQSAVQVGTEDADDAFDRQVQAYAQETVATTEYGDYSGVQVQQPAVPVVQQPTAVQQPANAFDVPVPSEYEVNPVQPTQPPAQVTTPGTANYAVQITNGTTGRLFVEAQDSAGHIFPCGPMFAGQSISSQPDPAGPLTGQITVVIRDPDKPGAPEIRRYKVDPPASYQGKTVGITILPGGQYRADVDNQVYYTSPAPQQSAATQAE